MKQFSSIWLCAIALVFTLSSCDLIGGIFKVGVWVGIIIVVIVVALIMWLVSRFRR